MRYYYDTEFVESGPEYPVELLSLGMVADGGREYYVQVADANWSRMTDWLEENVLAKFKYCQNGGSSLERQKADHNRGAGRCYGGCPWDTRANIKNSLLAFCDPTLYGKPRFIASFADYDWVVFAQLFGRMIDLPKGWPRYCFDVKQWSDMMGNPHWPRQESGEHNALADAYQVRHVFDFLSAYDRERRRRLVTDVEHTLGTLWTPSI